MYLYKKIKWQIKKNFKIITKNKYKFIYFLKN